MNRQELQQLSGEALLDRIRESLGSLVASERRVAETILADPKSIIGLTAVQLASRASTSAATVIRFARSIGFSGYQDMAISLAITGHEFLAPQRLVDSDSSSETINKVAQMAKSAVDVMARTVSADSLEQAAASVASAGFVLCIGAGLSYPVAEDLAFRLNHIGINADAPADRQIQSLRAGSLSEHDVCVVILHGGSYVPALNVMRQAKSSGAKILSITSFINTPLCNESDIALVAGGSSASSGLEAWPSRIAHLLLADSLIEEIIKINPDHYRSTAKQFATQIEEGLI